MTTDILHCGELLKRLNESLERSANNDLKRRDITFSQMKVLATLHSEQNEELTMKELERRFDVAQATIAGLSARLEKKGFVEGYTDPNDRRVKHIRLTASGRALCESTHSSMMEQENQFFRCLTEEEYSELQRLLQKTYDFMKLNESEW